MDFFNKFYTSILVLCFLGTNAFAQHEIKGLIKDKASLEPLIGATVLEVGTTSGTTTGVDGDFNLNATTSNPVLEISYVGYKTLVMEVDASKDILLLLENDAFQIEDIVVTGLGIKRQKRELGYSTDKVSGEQLAMSNAPNVVNALSGRSAGVQVISPNGVDGGTSRIVIRGNNNISGNNQPLIVVDGIPIENPPGLTKLGRGVDWGSAINNINAEDIEEINILKGPTASAKYGMRGANGVVLITTKKGGQSNGLGVEYSFSTKIITPTRYRKVQNKYGAGGPTSLNEPSFKTNAAGELMYPSDIHNNNGPYGRPTTEQFGFYSTGVSWGPEMKGQEVRWWDGELREYSPQPDNLKQFFRTGLTNTHNISLSKGGDFGSVRISMTHQGHEAVVPNSNFNQYTANIGSQLKISDKVGAEIALSYIKFHRKNSPSLGDDNNASFGKGILYSWPRSYKGLEEELNINEDGTRFNYNGNYPFQFTPRHLWWNTYNQNTYLDRNKFIGSIALNYQLTNWLVATARTGMDFTNNEFETKNNPIDRFGIEGAKYAHELNQNTVHNSEVLITASKKGLFAKDFNASFSVGGARWYRNQYGLNVTSDQWVNPWLFSFDNYSGEDENRIPIPDEIRYEKKINSLYSFLNLAYKNTIYLELSGRNDWSSSLPADNNSYFYPSASLSYILSEQLNLKSLKIDFLKLRAAYAKTANDTDPYQLDFVYDIDNFNGNQTAGLPNVRPPSQLRPQQADSYEAGITIGLFQSKVNLDFTYYQIESFDQILESPVPTSSGVESIRINNGVLQNKGYELGINYNVLNRTNGYLKIGVNLSHNENKVVSLGDGAEVLEIGEIWGDFGPKIMVAEGESYGTIYGYDYVRNDDGQPILNENGTAYLITENQVPVGNAAPQFIGGINFEGRYKNFTFSALVDTKIGGEIYAGSHVIGLQTGQSPETLYEREGNGLPYVGPDGVSRNVGVILPGVYADGQVNDQVVHYYYKYLPNAGGWGKIITTPGILDNTWVKLREFSINYEVPLKNMPRLDFIQSLNLSIVGRDLFYFYSSIPDNINPEGDSSSGNAQGLEWASLPSMRSISFRISTKF